VPLDPYPRTPNPSWDEPAWFIDPVNGDDTHNSGTTSLLPLKTYKNGLLEKWRTTSPLLSQDTTVTFMTDQPDTSDPVVVLAQTGSGGFTLKGALQAVPGASGSFSAVVVKDRGTGVRWNVTDNTKAANFWAAFVGHIVHDTTADCYFWVEADLGGATAQVSEPMASAVGNSQPAMVPAASGNAYQVLSPTRVNVVRFSPVTANGFDPVLQHIWAFSSGDAMVADTSVQMTECRIDSFWNGGFSVPSVANSYLLGVSLGGGYMVGGVITFLLVVLQGGEVTIDGDILVDAPAMAVDGTLVVGAAFFANDIEVPNITSVGAANGALYVSDNAIYLVAALWGPAGVHAHVGGDVGYGGAAASAFLNAGGLMLDGASVASSYDLTTGLWTPNIALTPTNLDTATAGGGFGDVAYGVRGTKLRRIA
jgi:hypothetical protein